MWLAFLLRNFIDYVSLNDQQVYMVSFFLFNTQLDSVVPSDGDAFMQKEVGDLKDTIRVSKTTICFAL